MANNLFWVVQDGDIIRRYHPPILERGIQMNWLPDPAGAIDLLTDVPYSLILVDLRLEPGRRHPAIDEIIAADLRDSGQNQFTAFWKIGLYVVQALRFPMSVNKETPIWVLGRYDPRDDPACPGASQLAQLAGAQEYIQYTQTSPTQLSERIVDYFRDARAARVAHGGLRLVE